MGPLRAHITVYGCQMNRLDAELVAEVLRDAGAEVVDDPAAADCLLYVTCSVRAHAENRVFSNIGALARRKAREPGLIVGLLGCMAQAHAERLFERAPLVDVVCAPGRLGDLPALLERARRGERAVALDPRRAEAGADAFAGPDAALDEAELARPLAPGAAGQAFVTVMRGCDNFCAYCIVPHARGPERSRPPDAVLAEVRRLADAGARQVTLLGQAVNKYAGRDARGRAWDLADLLAAAGETPGLDRLYFITNHPRAMTPRLAQALGSAPRVMPYLHMPAQAGADAVLARMNRGYTAGQYLERVAMAREARPDVALWSDFIVGFPGETEADFEATLELVRRSRPAGAFVFKYSPRPGTRAAEWPDDVPVAEKRRRNQALLEAVGEIAAEENRGFVGRTVEVFVEGESPRPGLDRREGQGVSPAGSAQLRGRTPCHRIVVFDGPTGLAGRIVPVRIERSSALTLFGRRAPTAGPQTRPQTNA